MGGSGRFGPVPVEHGRSEPSIQIGCEDRFRHGALVGGLNLPGINGDRHAEPERWPPMLGTSPTAPAHPQQPGGERGSEERLRAVQKDRHCSERSATQSGAHRRRHASTVAASAELWAGASGDQFS